MSDQANRMLRGGARAATGVVIIGLSVGAAAVLGSDIFPVPSIDRDVVSVTADTSQNARLSLVCTGAFGELGADPSRPTASIPGGTSSVLITGSPIEERVLGREQPDGSAPIVVDGSANDTLAAAELQQVKNTTLQGFSASSCAEPVHEQWLVGGATTLGVSSTIVLGNPFEVPATVLVAAYDEHGPIDAASTAGVLVPAGSQRIVSLNGYAPAREALAVRIESTGAAVTAALSVSQTIDINSFAVDTATRQLAPQHSLMIPGVANSISHEHVSDGVAPDADDFPVVVRVLAPKDTGTATVRAMTPSGEARDLGTIDFEAGKVANFEVANWPQDAQAIAIEASVPIVGGVMGSADISPAHDYAWFTPAPALPVAREIAVAVVLGGDLVIVNPGSLEASVTIRAEGEVVSEQTVMVPAGAAVPVAAKGQLWLTSTEPISAGVRVVSGGNIAGYPVLAPIERGKALNIFPR